MGTPLASAKGNVKNIDVFLASSERNKFLDSSFPVLFGKGGYLGETTVWREWLFHRNDGLEEM
ncbi:MAG: hypothetical protein AAFY26_15770 [Cyanobacteria bacterium J06638_22]